eukprot:SAG31_NODE_1003_length_10447_cov_3.491593_9_plen_197_part_00
MVDGSPVNRGTAALNLLRAYPGPGGSAKHKVRPFSRNRISITYLLVSVDWTSCSATFCSAVLPSEWVWTARLCRCRRHGAGCGRAAQQQRERGRSAATCGEGDARWTIGIGGWYQHLKLSQIISNYLETSQNISKHLKTSQNISKHLKTSQNISKHLKISQEPAPVPAIPNRLPRWSPRQARTRCLPCGSTRGRAG